MAHMDIFSADPFQLVEMTHAINQVPYVPTFIGEQNLFTTRPVQTETITIEKVAGKMALIRTSERGSPLDQVTRNRRNLRSLRTVRIALGDTITAAEVQGWREFGTESTLMTVQAEVGRRLVALRRNFDLTHEHMRLGAIQGLMLDADGSVIYNYYTEFGVSQAAEVDFELDDAETDVRLKCKAVINAMVLASSGSMTMGTTVHALCGETFFNDLVNHPTVRATYMGWQAAAELRGEMPQQFPFGGIVFHEYRGTDDGTTIAVGAEKALFYPVGAMDVFQVAYSPMESFQFVNTPGQPYYALTVRDTDRDMWVAIEGYSYPLYICALPEILQRAKHH